MMQEALNEWLIMDDENMKFHLGQYETPYRSTVNFLWFLEKNLESNRKYYICDLGCGAGAVLDYLLSNSKLFRGGMGIDISPDIVKIENNILHERKVKNCELKVGDILDLDYSMINKYDGIISLQTFNILPDCKMIIKSMCGLNPQWIAFSTLGFEGLIDYNIKLYDYNKRKNGECAEVFYNIYSLPVMKKYCVEFGYYDFRFMEFEMDIDLSHNNKLGRGTYTVKTENGKRIQISGAMMMPWYFVFVTK